MYMLTISSKFILYIKRYNWECSKNYKKNCIHIILFSTTTNRGVGQVIVPLGTHVMVIGWKAWRR